MATTQRHAPRTVLPQHRYRDSSQSVSVELWQAGLHGFHQRWDLLNVPWGLEERRAICCFACFLLSWLLIDLAFVVEICMGLTQSCYATEGFGVVLLPLLRLLFGPWPVATIRKPTAWLFQWILASTSAYTTYASCVTYWTAGLPTCFHQKSQTVSQKSQIVVLRHIHTIHA